MYFTSLSITSVLCGWLLAAAAADDDDDDDDDDDVKSERFAATRAHRWWRRI